MRQSVQQDPATGLWIWFDETWDIGGNGFQTKLAAQMEQNRYIDEVLEGNVTVWRPKPGDYVWWDQHGRLGKTPCEIIRRRGSEESPWGISNWVIRTLTGPQSLRIADPDDLEPMVEMEVLAIARAWPEVKL